MEVKKVTVAEDAMRTFLVEPGVLLVPIRRGLRQHGLFGVEKHV